MDTMITGAASSLSNFTFTVMGLTIVICALLYVTSIIMPEWKSQAIKGVVTIAISGVLLSFGKSFIEWLSQFNSF